MLTRNVTATWRLAVVLMGLLILLSASAKTNAQNSITSTTWYTHGYLQSSTGNFDFAFQDDGNLVVYSVSDGGWQPIWSSNTVNQYGCPFHLATRLVMQDDGNLVLYGYDSDNPDASATADAPLWSSETSSICWTYPGANPTLVMQDDGNLVIYVYGVYPIWCSFYGRLY